MPANLTPEYKRAEAIFRQASTDEEKVLALELMLQTIPKHKGTEHMRADIKRRLARLRETPSAKGAARQGDIFHVPKGAAAGQAALLGTPNCGKSALVAHLTNAHVHVAEFPFSTHAPVPGILNYEDVQIQMVDMPPITADHVEPGQTNTYRQCDLILVVVDLSSPEVTDQLGICLDFLSERMLIQPSQTTQLDEEMIRRMARPCFCLCAKCDLAKPGDFDVLAQMYRDRIDMMPVTIFDPAVIAQLGRRIFEWLRLVRVYSKLPGKPADMKDPFTLPIGATVQDLAYKIHRELAEKLRFARIWGGDKYPGQQVPRDYPLQDKDVLELHFG